MKAQRGRLHGESLAALAGPQALLSPGVGWFVAAVDAGDIVTPGALLGTLSTLGKTAAVVAPVGERARVTRLAAAGGRVAVDYKRPLLFLEPLGEVAEVASGATAAREASGLVFPAPSSGRFYGRPGPDKPAFVRVGEVVTAGQTLCLLEVMKTFHRVTYGGAGLPAQARIKAVLVAEESDVSANDALFSLEDAGT